MPLPIILLRQGSGFGKGKLTTPEQAATAIAPATTLLQGAMSAADKTKLNKVQSGAGLMPGGGTPLTITLEFPATALVAWIGGGNFSSMNIVRNSSTSWEISGPDTGSVDYYWIAF